MPEADRGCLLSPVDTPKVLPVADHPLSDDEITALFGPLFDEAVEAFRTQPEYLVELVEQNAAVMRRRAPLRRERERKQAEKQAQQEAARIAARTRKAERLREKRRKARELAALPAEERVIRLREQGKTVAQIVAETAYSESTVKRICRQAGIAKRKPNQRLSEDERAARNLEICNRVRDGMALAQVAEEFDLSRAGVRKILQRSQAA